MEAVEEDGPIAAMKGAANRVASRRRAAANNLRDRDAMSLRASASGLWQVQRIRSADDFGDDSHDGSGDDSGGGEQDVRCAVDCISATGRS